MPIAPPEIKIPASLAPSPFTQAHPTVLEKPYFSFQYLHTKRHVNKLEQTQQAELIKQLCNLSNLTWQQLRESHKHGLGFEKIESKLSFELPESLKSEIILAFRYCGKLSMVGFREKNVFHVLGIDKDFKHNSCYGH